MIRWDVPPGGGTSLFSCSGLRPRKGGVAVVDFVWWVKAEIWTGGGAWFLKACDACPSVMEACVELVKVTSGVLARYQTHPDGRGPSVVLRSGIVALREVDGESRKAWLRRCATSRGKLLEATEKGELPLRDAEED